MLECILILLQLPMRPNKSTCLEYELYSIVISVIYSCAYFNFPKLHQSILLLTILSILDIQASMSSILEDMIQRFKIPRP